MIMSKLIDIEGIGPSYAQKLNDAGVTSIQSFLKNGATAKGRSEIAKKSGFSEKQILEWVNRADLFRIKGIGGQYSDLLESTGVDTVIELANRNAENLYQKMMEVNEQKHLVRHLPGLPQVQEWIRRAKQLPRVVSY
jgi:predicted flap endonuclease-1-like 5' DNA nuclease